MNIIMQIFRETPKSNLAATIALNEAKKILASYYKYKLFKLIFEVKKE